jgi:hypothetical protein
MTYKFEQFKALITDPTTEIVRVNDNISVKSATVSIHLKVENATFGVTLEGFTYTQTWKDSDIIEWVTEKLKDYEIKSDWHEATEKRIILTFEDNAKLLKDVPELAVYIKENEINTYIDNFIYIYVNYLLPKVYIYILLLGIRYPDNDNSFQTSYVCRLLRDCDGGCNS